MFIEQIITDNAPKAIGTYSQAVRLGDVVYLSGQIPLVPATMRMVAGDVEAQIRQVFDNMRAIAKAAGGDLADLVKITVFLTDLTYVPILNQVMADYFNAPYPARSVVGVLALPRDALVEIDAVLIITDITFVGT